jgi:hypothetical protein
MFDPEDFRKFADYDLNDPDVHSQETARRYEAIAGSTIKQIKDAAHLCDRYYRGPSAQPPTKLDDAQNRD